MTSNGKWRAECESCPAESDLREFLEQNMREEEAEEILFHLNKCANCQRTMDRLTGWDSIFQGAVESTFGRNRLESSWSGDNDRISGFSIVEVLGSGGNGIVYRAVHKELRRNVAIKTLKSGIATTELEKQRFRANAEAMARLRHPNIVSLYSIGESAGEPYLEMEFITGGSLADFPRTQLPTPEEVARTIMGIAVGVQHAHEKGVLHRDLKPGNILLEPIAGKSAADGLFMFLPKVADFGLAKMLDGASLGTPSVAILGTPAYMSPEMAFGIGKKIGPWTDVYGIGAIGYELTTGIPPFQGATPFDSLIRARNEDPVPPRLLRRGLPHDFATILMKCMEKEPQERYLSAKHLADDLERFLNRLPVLARPIGSYQRAWRLAKRNPWVSGLSSALAGVVLSAVALLSVLYVQSLAKQKKLDQRLEVTRGALKQAAKIAEERFWFPQTIKPEDKEKILALYRFHEAILDEFSEDDEATCDCAYAMLQLSGMMQQFNDVKLAGELTARPKDVLERVAKKNPDNGKYLHAFAESNMQYFCFTEQFVGKDEAFKYCLKAVEIEKGLVQKHTNSIHYQSTLIAFERPVAKWLWEQGRREEALATQENVLNTTRELVKIDPKNVHRHGYFCDAAMTYGVLSNTLRPNPDAYLRLMREVVADVKDCRQRAPERVDQYVPYLTVFAHITAVEQLLGRGEAAKNTIKEGVTLAKAVSDENPQYKHIQDLHMGFSGLEYLVVALNDPRGADSIAQRRVKELEAILKTETNAMAAKSELALQLCRSEPSAGFARNPARAVEILKEMLRVNPNNTELLSDSYALALSEDGQHQKAIEFIGKNIRKWSFGGGLHTELFLPLIRVKCLFELGKVDEAKLEYSGLAKSVDKNYLIPIHIQWYRRKLSECLKSI